MRGKAVHRNRHSAAALVLALRYYSQRYALVLVILSAVGVFAFAQHQQQAISALRMHVLEATLPVANVLSAPLDTAARVQQNFAAWSGAVAQNEKLQQENMQLRAWQQEALRLQAENVRLRGMLQAPAAPRLPALTAPVVGDAGGSFQQALLALAGINDAVDVDAVALGPTAVIGRVVEVGNRTARILLLTDINSRVPVRFESTAEQAIAAGNGSALLEVKYLPADAMPVVGERVVTSGHGGVFPAGLPVGVVVRTGNAPQDVAIQPLENARRLAWVRLLDYRNPTDIVSK